MRLFQNSALYPSYVPRLRALAGQCATFASAIQAFLSDRFGACHILAPVLESHSEAFFANGDDEHSQRLWAREQGLPGSADLEAILLAQIEDHRAEVFYNLDPMRYASHFVRKLPGCVRKAIAWRAAPSPGADFSAYDLVVCNFPSILRDYQMKGWKADWFSPSYDPEMAPYARNRDRPIDVLFVGGYTRHHRKRAQVLEQVASLRGECEVVYCLDRSRLTRLAESPVGRLLPLGDHRRPKDIRAISRDPVFGRDLYALLARTKIVLNGAIDMAGEERGNMRCFEAMGCGALLFSDAGRYPEGMEAGSTLVTYDTGEDARRKLRALLADRTTIGRIAEAGHKLVSSRYDKAAQWSRFERLAG